MKGLSKYIKVKKYTKILRKPNKLQTDKTKTIKANMNIGSSLVCGKGKPSKFIKSIILFIEFFFLIEKRCVK